ncbi:Do family serine endopeptidase [Aurantimonas sp. HBX-1]|uniref:Do family serine endopeptidase n=1 Tax=Aurantimonas sp. HBX-1 TaxID=2906072 RepID=UPI001F31D27B|nr:Do family serine endopeptidase [Aurantimonas sp. HBX-1]UIJ70619.1 Do family serine endopeptidase [Aurantimonas sp. HBX-1]
MRNQVNSKKTRRGVIASVLAAGVAGSVLAGGMLTNTVPVLADPVKVEAPTENFGFADVVEKVSPAVVSVRVTQNITPAANDGAQMESPFGNLPEDHPLRRFFDVPGSPGMPRGMTPPREPRNAMGQGSGFFISDDGYVVTNNHVVEGGSKYTVVMDDGTEFDAKLIGTDPRTDLALLKVDDADRTFTYVEFGSDDGVRVGEWVVAVGNPFGLGGSVTAGIVSARGRDIGAGPYDDFLQIDAAVNRGNSGGPAFDLNGKVIGVNTAIFSPSGGNVGIAFAIPASVAKDVIKSLRENGSVERGWLGVQIAPVTADIAEAVGLADDNGAIVTLPDTETPASKAGIETGDVITAVNGETVEGPRELARKVADYRPNAKVDVTVWRDGKAQEIAVTLGDLSSLDEAASAEGSSGRPSVDPSSLSGYGLTLTPSEDGDGVVVTNVDPDSSAADRGVQAGDVIVAVNGTEVSSQKEVQDAISEASESGRNAALFQLRNGDQNRFVALPIAKS